MRKTMKTLLATACLAAVGLAMIPAQPAVAGMGTGNPPPPPPPPKDVVCKFYEGSSDPDLGGKGFPNIVINKNPSIYDYSNTTLTTDYAGSFRYRIATGDPISHNGFMFGLRSPSGSGDIFVATDSVVNITVASNEEDFNSIKGSIKSWKAQYRYIRQGSKDDEVIKSDWALTGGANFPTQYVPRNLTAKPAELPAKKVTFKLVELDGYDASGTARLKWLDEKPKGEITLAPGKTGTLTLHEIKAITQK